MHAFCLIRLCDKIFGYRKTFCIINGLGPQQVALNINIQYNMFPALSTNAVFAQCAFIRFASRYCITVQYCVPLDIEYATSNG